MKKLFLIFLLFCCSAKAAGLVDMKFGQAQIADTQWNVSACLYTTTCQIYSKAPGTAYKIPWYNGQLSWAAGDYVAFSLTGDSVNPWNAIQYSSNGTQKAVMGTGHIVNIGPDYFFFVGNDNNTGQLFSGSLGMNTTSGVTWTGTLNPTVAQVNAQASSTYSTAPLSGGQTAAPPPPPPPPAVTITAVQQSQIDSARARQTIGNQIYINQIGSFNTTNASQSGTYNLTDITINGDSNYVDVDQNGKKNYSKVDVAGSSNTTIVYQLNTTSTAIGHFSGLNVTGSSNIVTVSQSGEGEKQSFITVNGSNSTISNFQNGSSAKYSDIKTTGNGHTVSLDQKDGGAHAARIDVTNIGGASNINVLQQGNTNQSYLIQQSCATVGGCSITVTQQ